MNRFSLFRWVVAAVVCSFSCSNQGGGIGHEGEARISGKLLLPCGAPAQQTEVALYPAEYNPVRDSELVRLETTDALGEYHFSNVKPGKYAVVAIHENRVNRALISGIQYEGTDIGVPSKILQQMGSMKVYRAKQDSAKEGYVYIPGTMFYRFLKTSTDFTVIDSVPAGEIPVVAYASAGTDQITPLGYNVPVISNDTAVVGKVEHSRTLLINTSSTGATIAGNVTDIPLLIRLSAENFNFSQALPNGADVYFKKNDGSRLPHEIERWDASGNRAEIWVKVDTVFGNNSKQPIIMYWGSGATIENTTEGAVFGSANGFYGVWHLGDNSGMSLDATENRLHGTSEGDQARSDGIIGYSQYYDGAGDYTDMGNVCNPDTFSFTVCAWVNKATPNKIQPIMSKTTNGTPAPLYGWLFELGQDGRFAMALATDSGEWGDPKTFVLWSGQPITDALWHHVAAVVDRSGNERCRMYVDGQDVSVSPVTGDITTVGKVSNASPLRFATDAAGTYSWKGNFDEFSFSRRVRSADWIRLSYINQKENSTLIRFQ